MASPGPLSNSNTVSFTIASETTSDTTSPTTTGSLRLSGYTSPSSLVTFIRDAAVMGTMTADSSGYFDKTFTGITAGTYQFSVYATDTVGRTTQSISFELGILAGTTISLGALMLPPTITIDKTQIKRPESQTARGSGRTDATTHAIFNSDPIVKKVTTDQNGNWIARLDEVLHLGGHSVKALLQDSSGNQSANSQTVNFTVLLSADLNIDNLINLFDFSILMFNYARATPPNKAADINDNGPVDLVDFSVMMYYWTGG